MSSLQCTIRTREGGEIQKSAEIRGEGKTYLSCLSENLSSMQTEINTILTEMVDKEKGLKNGARRKEDSDSEGNGMPTLTRG